MKAGNSVDEILDFAISEEEAAAGFYSELAQHMDTPWMREVFDEFAAEEKVHKAKLLNIKAGGTLRTAPQKVADLKISDYLVDVTPGPGMSYSDALIVAMKKEAAAVKLYSALAADADDEQMKAVFRGLAQEEAKHKLRFETEYDKLDPEN